jgi:hypothetical protein
MGASGWHYTVKWEGSIEATFAKLRRDTFEADGFYWPWDEGDPENRKPRSLEEWDNSEYGNSYPGAHSIVDMREVITGIELDDIDLGQSLELSEAECVELLGSRMPSRSDLDRIGGAGAHALDEYTDRDSGRHVVLYEDGQPESVVFWGTSGD